jgi:hypothetical protein
MRIAALDLIDPIALTALTAPIITSLVKNVKIRDFTDSIESL